MVNLTLDQIFKPWETHGGKRAFFVKYADLIEDMIKDFNLKPIDQEVISPAIPMAEFKKAAISPEMMAYVDPGTHGGKRFAHFHYRGGVYMLNNEQWRAFTGRVKDDMINRLQMANAISIEQFQELNDAIDPIA